MSYFRTAKKGDIPEVDTEDNLDDIQAHIGQEEAAPSAYIKKLSILKSDSESLKKFKNRLLKLEKGYQMERKQLKVQYDKQRAALIACKLV